MTAETPAARVLRLANDPWAEGSTQTHILIARTDVQELVAGQCATLPFAKLGLDPADIGHDLDDEHAELHHHDGAFLQVVGFDGHDADAIRAVAEWFDKVAEHATALADALREQANRLCPECRGCGEVQVLDGDRPCRYCGGTGAVA